jgi:hypothetical protein
VADLGCQQDIFVRSWEVTVRNLKDEADKRAYHRMLSQLGLSEKDFG